MNAIATKASQEENRTKAAIGSLLFHSALLLALIFYTFSAPETATEPAAIVLDFGGGGGDNAAAGTPDRGMNDDYTPLGEEPTEAPSKPATSTPTPTPSPTPTPAKPAASTPSTTPTTTDAEVAAIRQQKEEQKQAENARQAEQKRIQDAANAAKRDEEARRNKVKNSAGGDPFGKAGSNGQGAGGGGKPGNGGINGGTGSNPFGKSNGTGGGTGGGDGTGTGASIGGGLGGRAVVKRGDINDDSQKSGKLVIEVCVDRNGNVTSASYTQRGSTTTDSELKRKAEQAAKGYRFASSAVDNQCGTITFNFRLK